MTRPGRRKAMTMTTKKPKAKAEKTEGATKQVDFVPSTTSGRVVRPFLLSEVQVDPRQPRAGVHPEKTANIENIAAGLKVEDGIARPIHPIQVRPTPTWAPDQTKPWMIFDGECRYLAACGNQFAASIEGVEVQIAEDDVFEQQVKTMARAGLSASQMLGAVHQFDQQHPGVNATEASVRLGMQVAQVRSLRNVDKLPSSVRLRFMAGEHTLAICDLLSKVEGATPEERAERQDKASEAVLKLDDRKAAAHIRGTYFLLLKTAPFDREDEALSPDAGKCSACKFRSGAQASLFASTDEAEDTCTKKSCWDTKAAAALATKEPSPPAAEPEKAKPAKKDKIEKPRKEDLQIAAYLARGDIASEDLEGHCGGMSADAINEALVRLEAAGNEKAKAALLDRRCEDPSPYSCGSALALATMAVTAIEEARAELSADDFRVFWKKAWPLFAEPGHLEELTSEEEVAPTSGTFALDASEDSGDMLYPDGDPS